MPFYVYILASEKNGTLYTGHTDDLITRVHQHRMHELPGFTDKYGVTRLVWYDVFDERDAAFTRERRMKEWKRAWKLKLIEASNPRGATCTMICSADLPLRSSRRRPGPRSGSAVPEATLEIARAGPPAGPSPRRRRDERRRWALVLTALALAGCSAEAQGATYASPIAVHAEPLPLSQGDPRRTRVGELTYAGGVKLTATGTSSFGGVSGIDVAEDGVSFVAQEDVGGLIRGRLKLDASGRLIGVERATFELLTGEDGRPYDRKVDADAEDVTLTPDGYAISYEQDHRVLAYPATGGAGVRMPVSPDISKRPPNNGLEALSWRDGRLYEGAEDGEIWRCAPHPGGACASVMKTSPFAGYSLTGLDAAGRGFVAVYRAVDVLHGWRAVVAWLEPAAADGSGPWRARAIAALARPLTRDNMEGIAAVPRPDGGFRLYLVSDDNFLTMQRTLLLAFDWPGPPPLPAPPRGR